MRGGYARAARHWLCVVVVVVCAGVAGSAAGQDSGNRIYRALETIRFERHCANAEAHRVQAYAKLESHGGRARALVLAYARHDAVRRGDVLIGLRLVALRVRAGEETADERWSVRLNARSARGNYVGAEHAHYDSNPARGEGERRVFRADPSGMLDWLDFAELGDDEDHGVYPYNWSPEMETTAAQLELSDAAREVALDLVLTQLESGEAIRLSGPTVWIPDQIWHERPPKPKVLGFFATLNPFQEGGVWQSLARGSKYRGCIQERRAAKWSFEAQL